MDENCEIYISREYGEAWESACCTVLRETRVALIKLETSLIQTNTKVQLPAHAPVVDPVVSIYFLFAAFKVLFIHFLYCSTFHIHNTNHFLS